MSNELESLLYTRDWCSLGNKPAGPSVAQQASFSPLENLGSRTAHGLTAPECLIPGMRQRPVCSKSEVAEVVTREADFVEKVPTPEQCSHLSPLPFKLIDENKQQVSC